MIRQRRKNRCLATLLIVMLTMMMALPVQAATVQSMAGKLVILHTNDTHGRDVAVAGESIGTAGVASLKKNYEAAGADVLLLSAGDAIQGKPLVNVSGGATAIEFMKQAGYDLMVPGNHEFDFGFDNLLNLTENAGFPMIAANITDKDSGETVFAANHIFDTPNGYRVGVFGLDTPETMTKAHPNNVKGLSFAEGEELYAVAREQVALLEAAGCELIVCVGHLGVDEASAPNRSVDVLSNVAGIDLFIDGHSHTEMPGGVQVNGALLTSTGTALNHVGVVTYDGTSLTASLIKAEDYDGGYDANVEAVVAFHDGLIQAEYSQIFASTQVNLNGTRTGGDVTTADGAVKASFPEGEGNRTTETNLGDFATDAMLAIAQQASGRTVDAAITNGGGIRETITAGNITKNDMITVFPFGNEISLVTVTGAQLLEALEAACSAAPEALGAFPQVSGMSFTIDVSVPYQNGAQYPDSTYYAPAAPGSRVKDVVIGGEALDLSKSYTIATNDFTAAGGDTYYAFKAAFEANGISTGVNLEDGLIQYITKELGGVIGSEYAQPQGRITIANAEAAMTAPEETAQKAETVSAVTYTVEAGDYLWKIAEKTLGDGEKWTVIYEANQELIADPSKLWNGQQLQIPA